MAASCGGPVTYVVSVTHAVEGCQYALELSICYIKARETPRGLFVHTAGFFILIPGTQYVNVLFDANLCP